MNLLADAWIPIFHEGQAGKITYYDLLCREEDWQLSLPRDDMEFAALQLLVCLTQIIFIPEDADALRAAEASPMSQDEFNAGINPYQDMFDLCHPSQPFMQTRGVKSTAPTPIQKLFAGLPEGNNHALFNNTGEVSKACPSCTAIALFNQANNCPNLGGGFKEGLRQGSPITTLISGPSLRRTIWRNILDRMILQEMKITNAALDKPVWVDVLTSKQTISAGEIGVFRGLFWQAARVELTPPDVNATQCEECGGETEMTYSGFKKEKFDFKVDGLWPHPHSPRYWKTSEGERSERFLSFTPAAPVWTQLSEMLIRKEEKREGNTPALVLTHFPEVFGDQEPLHLLVGGYRNKQSSIIDRRHELISLSEGWHQNKTQLGVLVDRAVAIKTALRSKISGFGKALGVKGLETKAEDRFYQETEASIRGLLRQMDFQQFREALEKMTTQLCRLAQSILEEISRPYVSSTHGVKAYSITRRTLSTALNKIRKEN